MCLLLVGVWLGKAVLHHGQGVRFAALSLLLLDLLTPGREVSTAVGEIALGCDPVVVERAVVVLEDGHADLRPVAGADDRLVRLLGEAARRVQPPDTGPTALVDVDERLPAVDDPDAIDAVEVADLVLRAESGPRRRCVPRRSRWQASISPRATDVTPDRPDSDHGNHDGDVDDSERRERQPAQP